MTITARDLADRLGLKRHPRSWRGDCPACDYAGTFSVKESAAGRARLYCASCQDGDAIRDAVTRRLGGEPRRPEAPSPPPAAQARQGRQDAALRLMAGMVPALHTPAGTYLATRRIGHAASSPMLGYRRDATHPESRGSWPAMIAVVSGPGGDRIAAHRTYLQPDGSGKADVAPARASLGPLWGGTVRIDAPDLDAAGSQVVVGEGIESSASAGLLLRLPAWAALSAGNLASGLILPSEIRRVTIASDNDRAGRDAAQAAARRWRAEGRTVAIAMPPMAGQDFNDALREGGTHA